MTAMGRLRLMVLGVLSVVLTVVAAACGDDGQASGTLPPIETTTTTTTEGPTTTTVPSRYRVKAGDQLGLICKKWGLDIKEVMALNNITNQDHIFRGQVLKLPPPTIPPSTTSTSTTTTTIDPG